MIEINLIKSFLALADIADVDLRSKRSIDESLIERFKGSSRSALLSEFGSWAKREGESHRVINDSPELIVYSLGAVQNEGTECNLHISFIFKAEKLISVDHGFSYTVNHNCLSS